MEDVFAFGYAAVGPGFVDDLGDVVADGFRQAGGMHRDDIRLVDRKDVVDGLQQVGLAAEHRGAFGKGAGGSHDRLLVVPGEGAAVVGVAPLGTVAVGQAAMDPEGCIHRPYGLAGFGRVDSERRALLDVRGGMSEQHMNSLFYRIGRISSLKT